MPLIYFGEEFEWFSEKAEINLRKHGIPMQNGTEIFADRNAIEFPSDTDQEQRTARIGMDTKGVILLVAWAWGETGRYHLISTRKADKDEQRDYARENRL